MGALFILNWRLILPIAAILAVIAICDVIVIINASGRTSTDVDELPHTQTGLLLGTSPFMPDHTPNPSFDNRVIAAIKLFKSGKIDRIIASGGFGEPTVMKQRLTDAGIPAASIEMDNDGLRTLLSIKNARQKYSIDSVIVISQKYHCERALMQADYYGLEAWGFNADNTPLLSGRIRCWLRERLARVKLMMDLIFQK